MADSANHRALRGEEVACREILPARNPRTLLSDSLSNLAIVALLAMISRPSAFMPSLWVVIVSAWSSWSFFVDSCDSNARCGAPQPYARVD